MDASVTFLRTLSTITYGLTLNEALSILDAAQRFSNDQSKPDLSTKEGLVEFARHSPSVMAHIGQSYETTKKIQAIKELRTLANCGLKEAKDAIDMIMPPPAGRTY